MTRASAELCMWLCIRSRRSARARGTESAPICTRSRLFWFHPAVHVHRTPSAPRLLVARQGGRGRLHGNEVNEIRTHLPQEPNSFVGRERELTELCELLGVTRALTLCGPGGIGKTRLALRVLHTMSAASADGGCFVDLGDLWQPDLVVPQVASALGISEEPGRPLLDTLADAVASRRLLLVLDNCEHLIDACAQVCQRLLDASPGLTLIATSREPLRVAAETVWQVPPLSVAPAELDGAADASRYEALRLFADRAAASLPGFAIGPANAEVVASLCRALDGMPLAIELAAARVRALSVEQIAERLGDRFALLTTGHRTAPPRHRTLRATIDWSHDLMATLVDKSLVVVDAEVLGQARYRLLDTIREYAAARLAEAGETGAFELRLRDYTLAVAERSLAIGLAWIPAPWS